MKQPITFTSNEHRERFMNIMLQMRKIYNDLGQEKPDCFDSKYGSALYILTSKLAIWKKAGYFVFSDHIEFKQMLNRSDWSHSAAILIELAGNLFSGEIKAQPQDFLHLDEINIEVAFNALFLRFYPYYRVDFEQVLPVLDATKDIL